MEALKDNPIDWSISFGCKSQYVGNDLPGRGLRSPRGLFDYLLSLLSKNSISNSTLCK